MTVDRPGVVLDAMVFLQAIVNEDGPAARIFNLLEEKKIVIFLSQEILNEARDLLNRPKIRAHFPNITDVLVEAFFKRLSREGILINQVQEVFEYPRDPKDEPYINLAIAAGADYIIPTTKICKI